MVVDGAAALRAADQVSSPTAASAAANASHIAVSGHPPRASASAVPSASPATPAATCAATPPAVDDDTPSHTTPTSRPPSTATKYTSSLVVCTRPRSVTAPTTP